MESELRKKILIIGLDGATWRLIKPWAESNYLPNFKKLMDNGSYGNLKSTYPPITPPAWTSMTTGKNPAKHGVFGFLKQENGKFRLYQSNDIKEPEIWDYLHSIKSIIVNLPISNPPKKIKNIMVSGMYTPSLKSNFAYPEEIKKEIIEKFPDYRFELSWDEYTGNKSKFIEELYKMTENRIKLFHHFIDTKEWDFIFYVFIGTDRIQHIYWDNDELLKFYSYIDTFLGEVIEKIEKRNESINLFIVSDHGFNKINKTIDINNFLHQNDFLFYKKDESKQKQFISNSGINKDRLTKLLKNIGLLGMYKKIPDNIKNYLSKKVPGETNIINDISMEKSVAYSQGFGTIYFNSDQCRNEKIKNRIKELKDPDNNKNIIKEIHLKEKLFSGKFVNQAPDIVLIPHEGYKFSRNSNGEIINDSNFEKADHEMNGIFLAYGPDIKKKFQINANIYDITPTILHYFGYSIPDTMDGRVLSEIFMWDGQIKSNLIDIKIQENIEQKRAKNRIDKLKKSSKL
ncbi:MAG: alkaline phosphatase family protein [Candidatus Methanoperedens sp.]|nr:alkaline phosphatase family protein [Candidatus Methanoperedens sp.]